MTSRRLKIHQYMPLIYKIVSRITHWSNKLLSYAVKIQLVKSVCYATTNYWLQCLPLPKHVIKHIDAIYQSFVWTSVATIKRTSLVAWKNVCKPRKFGGLNVLALQICNDIAMMKLLWNLNGKKDNLWVRWISSYYMKDVPILQMEEKVSQSWVFKAVLRQKDNLMGIQYWNHMQSFKTLFTLWLVYRLFCGNSAKPRALFTLWLACHGKMATRSRLM